MTEKIFTSTKTIVSMTEKIFTSTKNIVAMTEKIFTATKTIVSLPEKIFSFMKTMVAVTEKIFSFAKTIVSSTGIVVFVQTNYMIILLYDFGGFMKVVSATEAARTFSELLNKVRYLGETIEIQRGRDIVARLVPPGPPKNISLSELNNFLASLPHLESADGC
jgi:antitoxin (DNA-binding transcriptional repressor) of toxin-antitoxin stability system